VSQSSFLYERIVERFVSWAGTQEDIRAAFIVGSRARTEHPADELSDLDLVVITTNPDRLLLDAGWLEQIGSPRLTFIEKQAVGGGLERRVLFEDALDVDFAIISYDALREMESGGWPPEISSVLARGFRLILDKDEVGRTLERAASTPLPAPHPAPDEFLSLCNDFLYHAVWAAKKLRRGELWVASSCVDCYMKHQLLRMLEWHARSAGPEVETWHGGRFLESWANPRALGGLRDSFARYDEADVRRALLRTVELFRWVALETVQSLSSEYPQEAHEEAAGWIEELLGSVW
jgi:aminoglycoside 6-adenylyltransferase